MIPPEATTRGRSQQELILKMIEKKIQRCLLGPRPRRMIHGVTTPCGSNQNWRQSTSSGDQWKPRLRHDRDLSSVAGDTSEASTATQRLKSIYEGEGDAVKGPRSDEGYWR